MNVGAGTAVSGRGEGAVVWACAITPPQALDVARAWKGAEMPGDVEAAMETAAEVWTVHAKMARNRERTAVRDQEPDEG